MKNSEVFYTAAKVFTGQDESTFATAFAVDGDSFTWVGAAEDIPDGARKVDLGDRTVLPGLLDVHTHATYTSAMGRAVACTAPKVTDIPSLLEALREHPNYGRGGWIEGWGYDESKLAEHRTPTRHDLDQVSVDQPVYLQRSDFHSGVCNTRALELAGITASTPDPEDGRFGRDDSGEPNGVLIEHGANQVVNQAKGMIGFDGAVQMLADSTLHFAERGLVGVTDLFCVPTDYDYRDLFREAAVRGFAQQCRFYLDFASLQNSPVREIQPEDLRGRVALAGIKLFADGSMSNRTAWMRDPYPGTTDDVGMGTASPEQMQQALEYARPRGLQIAVHAMGDRAIEAVIEAYEHEEPWLDSVPSVRIEHATMLDPDLMERMAAARMHFGVASNIDFLYAEYESYRDNLTPDQFARAYMVKALYERVPDCALSSDCPATTWPDPDDPFYSMQAAVTRRAYTGDPITVNQAITIEQAVLMYTGRARGLVDMPRLGRIAPGYEAAFITLSQDIFTVPSDQIARTQVMGTWIQGERVFAR
ncbi:amidohydrolase [Devriesea agamarum]|uniref:amidohydrolase n=1 Tax=Devriesea agamarum TaxID=472569 RepID=UPI00071CFBD1|nr:amidohydrolase [Devriesea agamarum]